MAPFLIPQKSFVSIAGAILWGVLRLNDGGEGVGEPFQSQGRFFGGCCGVGFHRPRAELMFQSQGRFFGGCCITN